MSLRYHGMVISIAFASGLVACGGRRATSDGGMDHSSGRLEAGTDPLDTASSDQATDPGNGDAPSPPPDAAGDQGSGPVDTGSNTPGSDAGCGTSTDPKNCGSCGRDCTQLAHVRPDKVECRDGTCVIAADGCFPGFAHCS